MELIPSPPVPFGPYTASLGNRLETPDLANPAVNAGAIIWVHCFFVSGSAGIEYSNDLRIMVFRA